MNNQDKKLHYTPLPLQMRLWLMMFLQYFVQGCYLPVASVYVEKALGFSGLQVGIFGALLAVGPLLTPVLLGQIVDRHFATQKVLGICHILAGLLMLVLFTQTNIWSVMILGAVYSTLYVPTMMLTNSLAFHHLHNREREFPWVRAFGTLGFIVPAYLVEFWWLRGLAGEELNAARGIIFALSGTMGLAMGVYSLSLPHTPPQQRDDRRFAPGVVIGLLRHRYFLMFIVISFVIAITHQFFFVWNSVFLRAILDSGGITGAFEQSISSIGQICELAVMAVLGFGIARFGFKLTMLVGAVAYALRCVLFALVFSLDPPFAGKMALACVGQAMHGFCFGCFLAAAYMFVDRIASVDIRGSMQAIYGTFVIGLGFFVGGFVSGAIGQSFTVGSGDEAVRDWTGIWLSSAALAVVCVAGLILFFPRHLPGANDHDGSEKPSEG